MVNEDLIQACTPIGPHAGIYMLVFGDLFYIGSSKNINKRVTEHKRLLRQNIHQSKKLQEVYNNNPEFQHYTIYVANETEDILHIEQEYLDKYRPPLNTAIWANSPHLSPEDIMKKQGGERNHMAVISLEKAIEVVRLRNKKLTLADISKVSGVNYGIVASICSAKNWHKELLTCIPEELNEMVNNRQSLGIENRSNFKPSNRLFSDEALLEIYHMILSRKYTLDEIAGRFNTNKTNISAIKTMKTYGKDAKELLSEEEYQTLKELPKGVLKL